MTQSTVGEHFTKSKQETKISSLASQFLSSEETYLITSEDKPKYKNSNL